MALLASGLNGEEIARRLFVSPATVRTHIRNAMSESSEDARAPRHAGRPAGRAGHSRGGARARLVSGPLQSLRRVHPVGFGLALVFVAYVAVVDVAPPGNSSLSFIRQLLYTLLLAAGALICTVRAVRVERNRDAWTLIATALWAWSLGEVWFNTAAASFPGSRTSGSRPSTSSAWRACGASATGAPRHGARRSCGSTP